MVTGLAGTTLCQGTGIQRWRGISCQNGEFVEFASSTIFLLLD